MIDQIIEFFVTIESEIGIVLTVIIFVLAFFTFGILLNSILYFRYIHKYRKYEFKRIDIINSKRKKLGIAKIMSKLENEDNYYKLRKKDQDRLDQYIYYLIEDMKYNIQAKRSSFFRFYRVSMKIDIRGYLGTYRGKPNKVFIVPNEMIF